MGSDASVAPKERVNIKFVPATGDQQAQIELPMKTVVLGDFVGSEDDRPVESREAIGVDKNTFDDVFRSHNLSLNIDVPNTLDESDPDASLRATLSFESLNDFRPEAVARQIPELDRLLDLREALTALKGPLGNMPAFRKALSGLLEHPEKRAALLEQLGDTDSVRAAGSDS